MSDTSYVKVGPKGRIVVPLAARQAFDIAEGDELAVVIEERGVRLVPRELLLAGLRGCLQRPDCVTGGVDEFIEERRAAAAADMAEPA